MRRGPARGPAGRPYEPDHGRLLAGSKASAVAAGERAHPDGRRVGAVAVPAARDATHLQQAAKVARVAGHMLIVLCSRECRQDDVRRQLALFDPQVPVLIVDMEGYTFPQRSRTLECAGRHGWDSDTAVKRNAALLLARRLSLAHVLFLDDDVRRVDPGQVRRAVAVMEAGSHRAAGWKFLDYPDNSAVSHAYRRLRKPPHGRQGCFIGGGGLLVRIDDDVPHFPLGIYNEDWFFLFPLLVGREVVHLGSLNQLAYDPFRRLGNAPAQEFGDLIAESLFTLLSHQSSHQPGHQPGRPGPDLVRQFSRSSFWRSALRRRRTFLRELGRQLETENPRRPAGRETGQFDRVQAAVNAAATAAARIQARQLRAWIKAWLIDEKCWRGLWARMAPEPQGSAEGGWTRESILERLGADLAPVGLAGRVELMWDPPPVPPRPRRSAPARAKDRVAVGADR